MDSKVFLSYSRKDKSQVFALKDEIDSYLGSGSCWIDLHGIESDQQFADVIINAINHTPIFLFLYSENSKDSVYAKKELEFATKKKKKIVFVNIDGSRLTDWFEFHYGSHDIIDISKSAEVEKLFRNLSDWTGAKNIEYQESKFSKSKSAKKIMMSLSGIVIISTLVVLGYYYCKNYSQKDLTPDQIVDLADSLSTIESELPRKLVSRGEKTKIIDLYRKGAEGCDQKAWEAEEKFRAHPSYEYINVAAFLFHTAGYAWQCIEQYDKSIVSYKKAVRCFSIIVSTYPEKNKEFSVAHTLNNLSYSYYCNNNTKLAFETIDEAIKCNPDLNYYDSKGELLYLSKRYKEANEIWEYIVEQDKYFERNYWVDSCKVHF